MKNKKFPIYIIIIVFVLLCGSIYMRYTSASILCIPNENRTRIDVIAENATITEIALKYDNGILHINDEETSLQINSEGTEYIRVYYLDRSKGQHYVDFEIVISQYHSITISEMNALGQQVNYHNY